MVREDRAVITRLHALRRILTIVASSGRDSEYGRVAREFEAMADSQIYQAMVQAAISTSRKDPPENGGDG